MASRKFEREPGFGAMAKVGVEFEREPGFGAMVASLDWRKFKDGLPEDGVDEDDDQLPTVLMLWDENDTGKSPRHNTVSWDRCNRGDWVTCKGRHAPLIHRSHRHRYTSKELAEHYTHYLPIKLPGSDQ